MVNNYLKLTTGWQRNKPLDRLCEEQRQLQLRANNPNFRARKLAVVSSYRYYLNQCHSIAKSYEKANLTQITAITNKKEFKINIDSRTTWVFKS